LIVTPIGIFGLSYQIYLGWCGFTGRKFISYEQSMVYFNTFRWVVLDTGKLHLMSSTLFHGLSACYFYVLPIDWGAIFFGLQQLNMKRTTPILDRFCNWMLIQLLNCFLI